MTLRITLLIFRTTLALFIDAVPLTVAAYKPLLTSRRYHRGTSRHGCKRKLPLSVVLFS